jgi:hypothetical protein
MWPCAACHTSLGCGHVHAGRCDAQREVDQLGHLGGAHRLLAAGHHEARDRQHPGGQPAPAGLANLALSGLRAERTRITRSKPLATTACSSRLASPRLSASGSRPWSCGCTTASVLHAAGPQPARERRAGRRAAGTHSARSRSWYRRGGSKATTAVWAEVSGHCAIGSVRAQAGLDAAQPVADRLARQHAGMGAWRWLPDEPAQQLR